MLTNRQRGVLFNLIGYGTGLALLGFVFIMPWVIRNFGGLYAILFVMSAFVVAMTGLHVSAMNYYKNRSVFQACIRATYTEFGPLFSGVFVVMFTGVVIGTLTSGSVRKFVLLAATIIGILGGVVDILSRTSGVIRSRLP